VSHRNKKKKLSRKFRKMHHLGKPEVTSLPENKILRENAAPVVEEQKEAVSEKVKAAPAAKNTVFLPFEQAKSQDIMGNLKMVLTISALCLVFLGALYSLELRSDWVSSINTTIKHMLSGWTW
jgi:hypothetical protein